MMMHFHIADDHPLFRTALTSTIDNHFTGSQITESVDLETTILALEEHRDLDLLLLDLQMPGSQDLYGLISIREKFPTVPVAIISASEDRHLIERAMKYGASGFIPKSSPAETLYEAIQAVVDGQKWLPEFVTLEGSDASEEENSLKSRLASLTPQQYRVLALIREGQLNKQIAYELGVTEATIKAHVTAILRKLGANNRTQAVIMLSEVAP